MSKNRVLAAAAAAGAFSAFWHAGVLPWSVGYSDVLHLFPLALSPGWPYIDRPVEYPVLTGLLMRFLGWLGGDVNGYFILTAAVLGGTGALIARLLLDQAAPRKVLLRWGLAPSLAILLVYNWDALAVLCALAGLLCVKKKRAAAAGVAFALGFCFKLYPALYLAPVFVHWRKDWKLCARLAVAFAATAAAINLPFALINYSGWAYCFAFNFAANRLPNPDSIFSVVRFVFGWPQGAAAGTLSSFLLAAGLSCVLWRLRNASFARLSYGATLVLLLTAKFFSPQYALWLLPFLALEDAPPVLAYGFELANLGALFAILQYIIGSRAPAAYQLCASFVVLRHACLGGLLWSATSRDR